SSVSWLSRVSGVTIGSEQSRDGAAGLYAVHEGRRYGKQTIQELVRVEGARASRIWIGAGPAVQWVASRACTVRLLANMALSTVDAETATALRNAVRDCSERGLLSASKWASELLLSLPASKRQPSASTQTSVPHAGSPPRPPPVTHAGASTVSASHPPAPVIQPRHPHAPPLSPLPDKTRLQELEWEAQDADHIAAARAMIDAKDLAGEKQALKDWYKLDIPINTSLLDLLEMVKNATDPFLLFLKALFLRRLSRREEAIESALLSIAAYPWNWSAWTVLGECLGDGEEMFQVKTLNTLHSPTDNELGLCDRLLSEDFFPRSLWVMSLRACVLYHMHDFQEAADQFTKVLAIDPYRIDDIDIYSNILYVTEDHRALSRIAHEFTVIDKDRPEVCCLIGNYYSLRNEHEKAIKYFKRATQLDRTYLSAWTLMGHEYVETKNSHAAIEAYRKAVDVSRKDYRAWYGLGQAYELLSMHQYALHYYQHATALRPYDVRIWQAQGICYEEMGRPREAIECLKRALIGADPQETVIHLKLAKLHNDLDEFAEAAAYHHRVAEVCRAANKAVAEYAKSGVYVARYHLIHGGGDIALAKEYLEAIASSNAEEATSRSSSPSTASAPLSATTNDIRSGSYINGTQSAVTTPAPEPQIPTVASTSNLDAEHIVVDDDPPAAAVNGSKKRDSRALDDDYGALRRRFKRKFEAHTPATYATHDEKEIGRATSFAQWLAYHQYAALYPDTETPFADAPDAVNRLLPYHIFQHPREDLDGLVTRPVFSKKGKGKASKADLLREEVAETRFALDCWRRKTALEKRFRRALIHSGERSSPDDQSYFLEQSLLEDERQETVATQAELRTARTELEKLERERRAAAPPTPAPRQTRPYYSVSTTTPSSGYSAQYRYSYPYAQGYGTSQYTFSPAFQTAPAYPTTPVASAGAYRSYTPATPTSSAPYASPYSTTTTSTAPPATPTPSHYRTTTSAIPVQLPESSLAALRAIGLEPLAPAPAGQPQPAAVLKSRSGTTMQLEINVGSLQPAQMSGLALILNALTSKGVTVDGNASANSSATSGMLSTSTSASSQSATS
ncbi:hypothetical protein POSPLADRAFT_1133350, partial [Postia placenta MAD-698-R-SB12]